MKEVYKMKIFPILFLLLFSYCNKENEKPTKENTNFIVSRTSAEILTDKFEVESADYWQSAEIAGSGIYSVSNGKMNLTSASNGMFAVYNKKMISGHFSVEVEFTEDKNSALILFNSKADGSVDMNNFTLIKVGIENGKIVVSVSDRQNGVNDLLDNTFQIEKTKRYKNILGTGTYSLPWSTTGKKFKILRHVNEKFFHFYYLVTYTVKSQSATGWAELAPSKEWKELSGNFFAGIVAINGTASFDNFSVRTSPTVDKDDTNTGFKAEFRDFCWSGYNSEALVITFDKIQAPLTEGKRKFVFWKDANYVPCWFLDDNLLYSNEFVETWGGGYEGCHEPMSDRLLRFSNVHLVENTNERKVVHWQYVLCNPDYNFPDDMSGSQIPKVDEYYYIYPNGIIIRKIQYKPKLDTQFRNWHELSELIVICGNSTKATDHLLNPALSIYPLNGAEEKYFPVGSSNYDQSKSDATILAAHFTNHPAVYNVFSDNTEHPETYSGYPISIYKTWHSVKYSFTHWPVSKEQFWTGEKNYNPQIWLQQVNHSSLAGAGVYEGKNWEDHYKTGSDGRKYREFISLMGFSPKGNLEPAKQNVQEWLKNPAKWQ